MPWTQIINVIYYVHLLLIDIVLFGSIKSHGSVSCGLRRVKCAETLSIITGRATCTSIFNSDPLFERYQMEKPAS